MFAYLDTSSVVKLYVEEPGSEIVRALIQQANGIITSIITYAETRAVFARIRRSKLSSASETVFVKRSFEEQWRNYMLVEVTQAICHHAGDLSERYSLRGYDSVQLASFLEVAQHSPFGEVQFSTFDERLAAAATLAIKALHRG
jgi:uncharacterized protein